MKELFNSITKKEWLFVIFLSLAVIFITTAPAVYGWLKTPADKVFTGMHFVSADDWFVYYSRRLSILKFSGRSGWRSEFWPKFLI